MACLGPLSAFKSTGQMRASYKVAEPYLYEAITVYNTRRAEFVRCLHTLSSVPGKARLVRTFALTVVGDDELNTFETRFDNLMSYVEQVLRNMVSLEVPSVMVPTGFYLPQIELALQRQDFTLRRLYISGLKDYLRLMEHQPDLEQLCLWKYSTLYLEQDLEQEDKLIYDQFAEYRTNTTSRQTSASVEPLPFIFGVRNVICEGEPVGV
ncbi:hypothetical protein NMY22_g435 [Coprinellus aureogranulatus]|nr:hypothetical protein NMY22_g435 [Coprinellus aureogranulatus]